MGDGCYVILIINRPRSGGTKLTSCEVYTPLSQQHHSAGLLLFCFIMESLL
jgi:hypothetical protein